MNKRVIGHLISIIVIVCSSPVPLKAALIDNGNTVTQIRSDGSALMWLKNANLNGVMTWYQAQNWITSLNNTNYLGYNDWRLPINLPVNGKNYDYNFSYNGLTDYGENIVSLNSEMAYMYHVELGNLSQYYPDGSGLQTGGGLVNTGPFINLQQNSYWSGTVYNPDVKQEDYFLFAFNTGRQTDDYSDVGVYNAWAVRVVPEPASLLLLTLSSLLAIRKK